MTSDPLTYDPQPSDPLTSGRPASAPRSGHAVVLGAGVAGLLAARVLSETFGRVSVLDRDDLPDPDDLPDHDGMSSPAARRGVPQAGHLHALMDRGREILEDLHPGLVAQLVAAGAPTSEALVGGRWYLQGRRVGPVSTGLTSVLASRPLLERELRRRTAALPGVRLLPRAAVIGLVGVGAGAAVTGVRIRAGVGDGVGVGVGNGSAAGNGNGDGASTVLAADLVIDASGRNSRSLDWLAAAGHPAPPTSRVTVDLGYASRLYRRRPEDLDGDLSVIISTTPGLRGGGAAAVEGDRWIVTLAGLLGEHPPTDHEGFTAFARRLPVADIAELIRGATPLGDAVPYRFRESVRRHFEALRRPPDGLVVVGDALCSFNPLYAQGMTVAAQQILVLRDCLRDCLRAGLGGLPGRFYRAASPVIDVAWDMATASDLRYPEVAGRRTLRGRVTGSYAARAQRRAHRDPAVARTLMRVVHLAEPPTALLRPALAARVLAPGTVARRERPAPDDPS